MAQSEIIRVFKELPEKLTRSDCRYQQTPAQLHIYKKITKGVTIPTIYFILE